jgi:hypothetical protein
MLQAKQEIRPGTNRLDKRQAGGCTRTATRTPGERLLLVDLEAQTCTANREKETHSVGLLTLTGNQN